MDGFYRAQLFKYFSFFLYFETDPGHNRPPPTRAHRACAGCFVLKLKRPPRTEEEEEGGGDGRPQQQQERTRRRRRRRRG